MNEFQINRSLLPLLLLPMGKVVLSTGNCQMRKQDQKKEHLPVLASLDYKILQQSRQHCQT